METVNDFAIQFGMEVFPLVIIWTVLALFMMLILRIIPNLHPVLHYHTHSAIVLALPIGIVFGTLFSIPVISSSALAPVTSFLPLIESDPIIISSIGANESQMAQSSFQITLIGVLSALFLVSIVIGLTRLILIYYRLQRAIKHASPIQYQRVLEIAEEIRSSLGIKRSVQLKTMSGAIVPFTTGYFSPHVVLPEDYTTEENQLRFIMMHELIHVVRFDYVLHTLEVVVRHIFWMHPLVHVLYRQTSYWREVSCDVEVLKTAGNHTETYAKILYEFALKTQEKPIFRAAMAEESHLLRRIRAFTNQTINTKEITMKKSIIIASTIFLMIGGVMACSTSLDEATPETDLQTQTTDSEIFTEAEQMPQMIGGQEALFSVLTYPQEAREAGHEGRVIIQFVVNKEGNVIDPVVVRSSEHPALDNAAIEAIHQMQFEPGMQDNQPVNVQMVQPVVFRLQ